MTGSWLIRRGMGRGKEGKCLSDRDGELSDRAARRLRSGVAMSYKSDITGDKTPLIKEER